MPTEHPSAVRRPWAGRAASVAVIAALAASTGAAPTYADDQPADPDPLRSTLLPIQDRVIALLPAVPQPHQPYQGEECSSGDISCIDDVIARMQDRLDEYAASCHHRAIFSLAYLRVTENVREAVADGWFDDAAWLSRVDAVFAAMYFDTIDDWEAGTRADVPGAWRIALQAEDDEAMSALGNFLLAMNAHINRDFPHVLAEVGVTAPDGTSRKADHNAYNQRLDGLYDVVFPEVARRFDPTFDAIDAGTVDESVAGTIMRGWREMVWRHAEALVAAPNDAARQLVAAEIESYAATQASFIRQLFTVNEAGRQARNAWCAEHGTE